MELTGVRALVTGGARGIGAAIVRELAARGARVAAVDIDFDGTQTMARRTDMTDEADVVGAVAWAADILGGLDVLVNNAGIVIEKPLLDTTAADFDRVIAVNLRGVFLAGREAARHFVTRPAGTSPGRIINIASELAHLGRSEYSPYCASKGGVISLTRSWARELAPRVLVNAVAPGPTDTDMLRRERQYAELKATAEGIPLARLGEAGDIARAVAFLASADSAFMTGSVVDVNGGAAMY
ncbi:SDR family NAD(P)-dependent oxidoreductase [Acuticoccus mangrovi]|uniref:SDR family oxidoreductase n=1 Tax=Acuticoccus mangrovi TaxID=2796142 RepID=A0A934IPJ9_9HYPH|nr:SDR family oxidoreductase [Acuticoccus mangrovi]MBJ3775972.1 SDR family oxidoreductase [Acuticoccus mangrovi]